MVGTEPLQAIGLGVERVTVGSGHLDRDQDVATLGLVALPAGDLDQVEAEFREHRLGQGLERELERGRVEGRVHRASGPLRQISAPCGGHAVGGLSSPAISWRTESARARAVAVSAAVVSRGRATKLRYAVAGRLKSSWCAL